MGFDRMRAKLLHRVNEPLEERNGGVFTMTLEKLIFDRIEEVEI